MFKKKRDYGYYSSYGTSSRSRLKVGRVALVGAVGVVLVIGIVVVLNLTRIKLLIKGYSFSQASEILSLTKEQENENTKEYLNICVASINVMQYIM